MSVGLPAVSQEEHARTIALMRPPKRTRPLVAIIGDNVGAETTDLLVPFNVLSRSGVADVVVVAPVAAPIPLMPALRIQPTASLAAFDAAHPDGPDYVIVPAQHHQAAPAVVDWLVKQSRGGATIIGVCAGAQTLAAAGLLDHRLATSHWAEIADLRHRHPTMVWRKDRRYVADTGVVTTTGVTACLPMSLALVEAIGGAQRARILSDQLGAAGTDARHDSEAYRLDANWIRQALANSAAVWLHETVGLPVADGQDELALAFTADAYSRTYRSHLVTLAQAPSVRTAHGLELLADRAPGGGHLDLILPPVSPDRPAASLDRALAAIARRYGRNTAAFVALQLEYPWPAAGQA
jgi:transcriptional regulator GlxA family with amidase domain